MIGEYQKVKESKQSWWIFRLGRTLRDQVSRMKGNEVLGRPRTKKRDQAYTDL